MTLFDDVVGQDRAVAQLRAAAAAPVHAYLLVGPPGSGTREAARSFAAALLCHDGGCDACRDCQLARREIHPDAPVVERVGAFLDRDQARSIVERAALAPVEGARKVMTLVDMHLVRDAAPILLKTLEEPPASTVFVVLAEDVPRELVTIASRCVRVELGPVPDDALVATLVAGGTDAETAAEIAAVSGGRLDRARLLAADPGFATRIATWRNAPARLDGTGAAVAVVAAELLALVDDVAAPLARLHEAEATELAEQLERYGDKRRTQAELKRLADRHKREQLRLRLDEKRFGLGAIEAAYRDAVAAGGEAAPLLAAADAVQDAARELIRNPTESLLLQALLLRLPPLEPSVVR